MQINNIHPSKLIVDVRDGLIDQIYYGFVQGTNFHIGENGHYPYFLRSCAKPLQASLIFDYGLDFDSEEVALCCASHAGEVRHVDIAKRLLAKVGLREELLKCGLHKPISVEEQQKLIIKNESETVFQNNCVGKHIMLLALCKHNNWDYCTYDDINHPLQKAIKQKIYELCEVETTYPITKDGCGVPIQAMPLKNILKGYLSLFGSEKYERITQAFLNNPYIIGGYNRLDTKIMESSEDLVAKVGAGGLCVVVNVKKKDGFIVKISSCNEKAREIAVISILKKLGWADIPLDVSIKTLHGDEVGQSEFIADINFTD